MNLKKQVYLRILLMIILISIGVMFQTVNAEQSPKISEPLVTATFFDSDLREAIREVSLQTGVNIVVDENVKGLISLELKNVPLEKALRMMLIAGGLSFHKVDDYYVVGLADPKNPAFAGLCDTEIFYFKNITADSAKALLPTFYEAYVKFDPVGGSATVSAPPELLKKITADLEKMDGDSQQIKIKALVTEIRSDTLKEWGIDLLQWGDLQNFTRVNTLDISNGVISSQGDGDFGHFIARIKALVNEKKATVHADPVMIVSEGKTGSLFVGEKRTLILQSLGTNATSSTTENVEAGTTLKVTPRIFNDQIELTITQQESDFEDEDRTDQILVRSREFSSVVRFLPGQTVMVAGLTEKKSNNNVSKTPLLGDIPIVRLFFRQKSDQKTDTELIVFLTAEVIKK